MGVCACALCGNWKEQVERLLKVSTKDGSFLVRRNRNDGHYTVSFRCVCVCACVCVLVDRQSVRVAFEHSKHSFAPRTLALTRAYPLAHPSSVYLSVLRAGKGIMHAKFEREGRFFVLGPGLKRFKAVAEFVEYFG